MGHWTVGEDSMTQVEHCNSITDNAKIIVSPVNPAQTFHVPIKVIQYECQFLVDTGAAVTLMSTATYQKLQSGKYRSKLQPWKGQRLVGVDGSPLQAMGTIDCELVIDIVHDLATEEAILGLDFLQKYGCIIDIPHRKLLFPSYQNSPSSIPLQTKLPTPKPTPILHAKLQETVTLPPCSEMESLAVVDQFPTGENGMWLLEDELSQRSKPTTLVARAIVRHSASSCNPNLSTNSAVINKGTKVATLQS